MPKNKYNQRNALFVVLPKLLLVLLVIDFTSGNKVLKEYAVVDNLYMEDEESTKTANADAS